jgi:hypothetical protein
MTVINGHHIPVPGVDYVILVTGRSKERRCISCDWLQQQLLRIVGEKSLGRTIPSFRLALAEEKSEWGDYRKHLDRSEKKDFEDMFEIPRLYISACSGAVSLVRIHPIFISILFHHYKELMEIAQQIGVREQIIACH